MGAIFIQGDGRMNVKLLTKTCSLLLCGALLLPLLASCTGGGADVTPTPLPDVVANETAPDRGTPDRSDLMYLDAIEKYEKTDWTAQWI